MGVSIEAVYEGNLRCVATHGPSKSKLETDAPTDNMGRGERFSPTDLIATALITCMATTCGIAGQRKGWNLDGLRLAVTKEMSAEPPRRIARLPVEVWGPRSLDAAARAEFEHIARTCPVYRSIAPGIETPLVFHWPT